MGMFPQRPKGLQNLLKLKSGESVRGVFRGGIHSFRQHWVNNRSSLCEGAGCKLCNEGDKSSFRFQVNFLISENGAWVAKVLEQGGVTYDKLTALESEWNLPNTMVKITRLGAEKQTKYDVTPLAKSEISAEMEKEISKVKLNDLTPHVPESSVDDGEDHEDNDIPF